MEKWTSLSRKGDWSHKLRLGDFDFVAGYAGVIGHAQGLDVILEAAKLIGAERKCAFVIVGHGPERERLTAKSQEMGLNNVIFTGALNKAEMKELLPWFDCSIVPLRKSPLFLGAIPSKIFENLAAQVPVVLGVEGEAEELFIEQGKCALKFEPENSDQLAELILKLEASADLRKELKENGRSYVEKHFNRVEVNGSFVKLLEEL